MAVINHVQCEACKKWRLVPDGVDMNDIDAYEMWDCSKRAWHTDKPMTCAYVDPADAPAAAEVAGAVAVAAAAPAVAMVVDDVAAAAAAAEASTPAPGAGTQNSPLPQLADFVVYLHALVVLADAPSLAKKPGPLKRALSTAALKSASPAASAAGYRAELAAAVRRLCEEAVRREMGISAALLATAPSSSRDSFAAALDIADEESLRRFVADRSAVTNPIGSLFYKWEASRMRRPATSALLDAAVGVYMDRPGNEASEALLTSAKNREGLRTLAANDAAIVQLGVSARTAAAAAPAVAAGGSGAARAAPHPPPAHTASPPPLPPASLLAENIGKAHHILRERGFTSAIFRHSESAGGASASAAAAPAGGAGGDDGVPNAIREFDRVIAQLRREFLRSVSTRAVSDGRAAATVSKRGKLEGTEAFEARRARALPIAALAAYRSRVPFLRFQFLRAGAASDVDAGGICKALQKLEIGIAGAELLTPRLRLFISTDVAEALVGVGALGGSAALSAVEAVDAAPAVAAAASSAGGAAAGSGGGGGGGGGGLVLDGLLQRSHTWFFAGAVLHSFRDAMSRFHELDAAPAFLRLHEMTRGHTIVPVPVAVAAAAGAGAASGAAAAAAVASDADRGADEPDDSDASESFSSASDDSDRESAPGEIGEGDSDDD